MDAERSEALELLARPGWAWRLAHALARDEAEAEDALGEARLAALRGPIAKSGGASLRGWVATVVRNALRQGRRSEARRGERERAVARTEALAPTQRLVEREEARRKVVEALLALPEPYRAALIAHHYDGLSPSAIAAREGVPPSTVRNRLLRGRELLRRELARADGREPREWLAAVAPLLVRPEPVGSLFVGGLVVGSKVIWTIGAAAALALVGSLWWWSSSGVRPGVAPARASEPVAELDEVAAPIDAQPRSAGVPGDRTAAVAGAGPSSRERIVRVVDAVGTALPGAQVTWAPYSSLSGHWKMRSSDAPPDLERWMLDVGRTEPTDQAGECRLPAPDADLAVCARAGELWKWDVVRASEPGPVELVLEKSHDLGIEVVDASGSPVAGAHVGLFMRGVDHGDATTWSARTDAEGRATIYKLEQAMRNGSYPSDLPFVGFVGPLDVDAVPVDPAHLGLEPLRLVMPATGSLRVRLSSRGTTRFPAQSWISVTEMLPDRAPGEFRRGRRSSLSALAENGVAEVLWTHVSLGLELELEAHAGEALQPVSRRIRGPEHAGEERLVELELEPVASRVAARLVDGAGAPLKLPWVSMYLSDLDPQGMPREVLARGSSDADGRVVLPVDEALRGRTCRWRLSAYERPDQPLAALARTLVPLVEGELDLGDVVLQEPPIFVAGTVLDANGAPIPGRQVSVARWTRMGGEGATELWNWDSGVHSPNTDDQGRFVLRDDPPPGRFALAVRTSEFGFGPFVPFERGATNVVLHVAASGTLAGRLVLPEGVDAARLRVGVTSATLPAERRPPEVAPRPDGSFEFAGLEVGPYSVRVRRVWDAESAPLFTVDDVHVSDGDSRRDPRLDPLDLRGRLHALDLELVDGGGAPVPRGQVALRPEGTAGPVVRVEFTDGAVRLCGAGAASDLDVVAPGFRTARVEAARGATRVVLEPGFAARVHLPPPVEFPRSGVAMRLGFWHDGQPRDGVETVFDEEGSPRYRGAVPLVEVVLADDRALDVVLPEAGTWSVAWVVHSRRADGSSRAWGVRAPLEGSRFVVPEDGAPIEVWLAPPDADDLARVLALVAQD